MSIEPEVVAPPRHPATRGIRDNPIAALTLALGVVGLAAVIVRQLVVGGFEAPPLWLSLPLVGATALSAIAAVALRQRRWAWLAGGLLAAGGAVFLGWFLLAIGIITVIYALLQLVG